MIETVIWDWNGTILADTSAVFWTTSQIVSNFGGKAQTHEYYRDKFFFPIIDFYCTLGCDRSKLGNGIIGDMFERLYEERSKNCRTRKGARKTIRLLYQNGKRNIILSNHIENPSRHI